MLKLRISLFTLLTIVLTALTTQALKADDEVKFFEGTWEEALASAKKNQKPIFVDAYAVWCGPCKYMDQYVFTEEAVATYFNKTFINYKLDVDVETEIAENFGIEAMPTYLFVDAEGAVFYRKTSAMEAEAFLKLAQTALRSPELKTKYANGDRSEAFLLEYLTAFGEDADEEITKVADEYIASLKEEDLLLPQNFELLKLYPRKHDSREFKFFVKNIDQFIEKYAEDANNVAYSTIDILYGEAIETQSEEKMQTLTALLQQMPQVIESERAKEMGGLAYMNFYEASEDWEQYAKYTLSHFEEYGRDDFESFMRAAYNFYQFIDDKAQLQQMLTWIEEASEEEFYAILFLNAALLKKLDRKKEALEKAKIALEMAQTAEANTQIIEDLIAELE